MKVLVVGNGINLSEMLKLYGVESVTERKVAAIHPDVDFSMIYGAWSDKRVLGSMFLVPGTKIMFFRGTDAYRLKERTRAALQFTQRLGMRMLYNGENLRDLVGLEGDVWTHPIYTPHFKDLGLDRDIDVLFYCRAGRENIYLLDKFKEYIAETGETYSIVDGSTPREKMPELYNQHKKYVRITSHDSNPKMPYEAFLCGCESWDNGRRIVEVPDYLRMEYAIPRLIRLLEAYR